jgi:membrane protein YqaA with SNARE-associated domain
MLDHALIMAPITLLHLQATRSMVAWARRVGGPGLIVLGVIDNSAIPVPGSQDVMTIILAASQKNWWLYYAFMATAGAVLGGYITYRLARKEGKAILERRVSRRKAQKVYATFEKWGFWAVVIPALLPPPLPMFPFLLAAGAMQYSRGKFLAALAIGRAIRYTLLAYLAANYGRQILRQMAEYREPVLLFGIAAAVAATLYVLVRYKRSKRPSPSH